VKNCNFFAIISDFFINQLNRNISIKPGFSTV